MAHLRGEIDLPAALELIQRHSRQFAKRQLSWFRQEKDIHWFAPENIEDMTRFISQCLAKKP
jgi:tRNA dimethylallyltransferase